MKAHEFVANKEFLLHYGEPQSGYISMNKLGISGVEEGCLDIYFGVGDIINAEITGYSEEYDNWFMRIK